jgi:hypothetical protein
MAFPSWGRRKRHIRFTQILPRRTNSGKIQLVEDLEYRAQRGLGNATLARAIIAVLITGILLSLSVQSPAAAFVAAIPAALAIGWFTSYAAKRRLRARLTDTGIETRRLRTKVIPWTQIRDVKVVNRVTVAQLAVMGSRASGRRTTRSGGGARKLSSVRVQYANGRWRELPVPVAWENAPDPEFTGKAEEIRERWRAAINQAADR